MTGESTQRASDAAQAAAEELAMVVRRLIRRLGSAPTGGLTPAQRSVLLRLEKDGASSTTFLAIAEGVRSQSMTATLKSLDALGLIERRPDPGDGRRQIITLSAQGRDRVARDRRERRSWLAEEMDRRFGPEQLATINEALSLLGELADQRPPGPARPVAADPGSGPSDASVRAVTAPSSGGEPSPPAHERLSP
ncbi:MarR family winged helix-turn-helix transcriptional regulator [Actinomadura montaniterrae]|uniref:Winged helix-turn-helix transcriptional regulator n=1 Tax=Actinomadura montaniterrae TaxID=1803903 RepID=A0A6L3W1R3_9ACTN|nr:MarR family winged helix-turn-helix transcriptional regulator [Actinomadura montaniterrae]KAB2388791.1 winged helix-turn-helix transcriptional regulator [Actinomadura montaniterrae]